MRAREQRAVAFTRLADSGFDVLIIGGGIVGAGIARDAALRGLKTALVEQHDFAFGTSSRSSRLLHGGLRYLAQGRLGLVREASVEKTILHRIAPHLSAPLPFLFPTYRSAPDWRLWQLKLGVKIYDLLCGGHNLGRSTWLDPAAVMRKVPGLKSDDLSGAVRYFDAFTNDARLVLDTLRSAARAGAVLVNYCRFTDAQRNAGLRPGSDSRLAETGRVGDRRSLPTGSGDEDNLWTCEVEDVMTRKVFSARARTVVNATGPWADGLPHSRVKLRVTKGVHLVVERSRVPVPETVVMTAGKRILFAIPWGERTILGTTDTDYQGSADRVMAGRAEVDYLLKITNQFFPDAALTAADVISTWAGLRPLLADPHGQPSDLSRSHEITNPEPGWWDVAGGKLTTHRLMAEQAVDRIVKSLNQAGESPLSAAACRTAEEPLRLAGEAQNVSGILPPEFCRRVVEQCCAQEWVVHLDDVMVRRTGWQRYHRDADAKAEQVAGWMAELFGWTDAQRAAELARYQAEVGSAWTGESIEP